jgi:hypothetical protein
VDLPTFGSPTIPHLMPIGDETYRLTEFAVAMGESALRVKACDILHPSQETLWLEIFLLRRKITHMPD